MNVFAPEVQVIVVVIVVQLYLSEVEVLGKIVLLDTVLVKVREPDVHPTDDE